MAIKGNLAEFSLPEIFRFLAQREGSGLLSIHLPSDKTRQNPTSYYVWMQQGQIVAVADRLDGKGLVSLISQRGWLRHQEICEVLRLSPRSIVSPTGLLLKEKGALNEEQLKLIFIVQVVQRVCSLFKLQQAEFVFDTTAACPWEEMTGLNLSATEATLLGLRVLRNWEALVNKLPNPNIALTKTMMGKARLKLDSQEWQVWECVNGKLSLQAVANRLNLSTETVQQIVFRLSMVGLVEEVPKLVPPLTLPRTASGMRETSGQHDTKKSMPQNVRSLFGRRASFTSYA